MLTRLDQRPDLLREFYTRWDDWRANGMTPAETQEFWSWLRRHAVINLQAMTVEAHEPCS